MIPNTTQSIYDRVRLKTHLGWNNGNITWLNTRLTNTAYKMPMRYLLKWRNLTRGKIRKKNNVKDMAIK
jgi:hypothetical protein